MNQQTVTNVHKNIVLIGRAVREIISGQDHACSHVLTQREQTEHENKWRIFSSVKHNSRAFINVIWEYKAQGENLTALKILYTQTIFYIQNN